jgi:hypothetical protein
VKQRLVLALLAGLTLSTPAAAQGYEPNVLPPHQIMTIIRSTGFDPIGQPMRRGPNYVLNAIDDDDREVTLIINGRSGRILSATPMRTASRMQPGVPPGGSMGEWQRMPPGYVPPPGYRAGAPVYEDDEDMPRQGAYGGYPPAPGTAPRTGAVPQPRLGSAQPDDQDMPTQSASRSDPTVIPADPPGALPPPPERFPHRAAPTQQPKPANRTASAPPKTPLPKPKPAAPSVSVPPVQAAPAQPAPQPPAPAKAPVVEETPI